MLRSVIKWLTEKWSRKKTIDRVLQEGVDYQLIDVMVGTEPAVAVRLIDTKYSGVVYYYDLVKISTVDDKAILSFNYMVYDHPPEIDPGIHLTTNEFKTYIGNILVSIMMSDKGEYATIRNHDSKESDL